MQIPLVPDRIAAWAAASPEAVAIAGPQGEELSYAKLTQRADQVAHYLLARGIRQGDLVGVCLDRGPSLIVALLGVLRAGCAYLPLDPEYPPGRLRFMLDDSGATAVVGAPAQLALVTGGQSRPIELAEAETADVTAATLPAVGPDDLAYVIYTSGSTGTPKGVAVEHRQVARLFDAVQQRIPAGPQDIWSWFHSVAFDFSVWEIWGALTSGGRLAVVTRAEARDPSAFLAVLRRSGTTILSQTPSAFQGLRAAIGEDTSWPVRAVVLGGEAVNVGTLADLLDGVPGRAPALYNLYGITEATVHVTVKELTRADLHAGVRSPIGTPLADLRLAVLDQDRRPVPAGEPGELWVGGAGVGRGYIARPQLTAEHFVTGLSPDDGGLRWYRSGDLVRQLPSGEFEYIGRIDRQVKLRGYRIELGEIEAALMAHPAVSAAAVELRDAQLAAYLTLAQPGHLDLDAIREWLTARLPSYMIPASFLCVASLPLTPNGKLDRDALARQPGTALPRSAGVLGPQAGIEAELHAIWANVLELGAISRHDSFFAIGGDSMLALRVVAACKRAGIGLTVRDLFTSPTLAGLASRLGGHGPVPAPPVRQVTNAGDHGDAAAAVPSGDASELIPANQMQRGMLFEAARNPGAKTYQVVSSVRINAARDLSEPVVRAALERLAEDNCALRMSFDLVHHRRPMQIVHPHADVGLSYLDLSAAGRPEQDQRISEMFAAEQVEGFTERDYPLWRVSCVRVAARTAEVMLTHHHAILDGWSVACFFDQLSAALDGRPRQTAPASVNQLAVRLEDEAISSAADRDFWAAQARVWSPLPLTPRAAVAASGVVSAEVTIEEPLWEAIRSTAARWQCSPKHVFLAAHLRALATFAAWDDYAATGIVVNARPELVQAVGALGVFLNVVPLTLTSLGSTWEELGRAASAAEARLQPHRWFPQATMVTQFRMPPLNVCFNYTDFSATTMHDYLARVAETGPNSMPLTVSVVDDGLAVEGISQYFSAGQCSQLAEAHLDNLRAAIAESRSADPAGQEPPGSEPALAGGVRGEEQS